MNASLIRAIKDFVALFESRGLTYAILGGLAASFGWEKPGQPMIDSSTFLLR